ncbi:MAG: hypothetical protein O3A63_11535 [Proteobacteria bacterium]|nr:hypothetical protein [Pseudomonadota bacterium]
MTTITANSARRSTWLIGLATAFSLLGDQVLYSVLPVYYTDLGITPVQVGILLSANRWVRLLTNELAHRSSGVSTQRLLFVLAFALGCVTTFCYVVTSLFVVLLAARLAWGLSWSYIRHFGVQSMMEDVQATRAGWTMGLYNGISRSGSVAGLFGGAVAVDVYGFTVGVVMLGVISLLSIPLGYLGFRNFSVPVRVDDVRAEVRVRIAGFVLGIVGPGLVMGTLGAVLNGYLPDAALLSAATATGALLAVRYLLDSVAAPWLGAITDRFGLKSAASSLFAAGGLFLIGASFEPALIWFVPALLIFFVCGTALQAGIGGAVGRRGSGSFARYVTASDLGAACGPLLGWLLVDYLESAAVGFAVAGVIYLLGALTALGFTEGEKM